MSEHDDPRLDPRDVELLAELLQGDPADDARAAERLGAKAAVRARLAELRAVEGELGGAGESARAAAMERARAGGPAPGEERAMAALELAMAGPVQAPRAAPARRWLPWLVAAAALVVALWLVRGGGEPDTSGEGVLLGDEETEGYAPRGRVAGFERFEWPAPAPSGSVQRVRAWTGAEALGPAALEGPDLEGATRWTPTPEERARLGARFVWRVVSLDPLGRADESPLVPVELGE